MTTDLQAAGRTYRVRTHGCPMNVRGPGAPPGPPSPRSVMTTALRAAGRTYRVRTYGCQMNVHDSERLSGLLEAAGYAAAPEAPDADVAGLPTPPGGWPRPPR